MSSQPPSKSDLDQTVFGSQGAPRPEESVAPAVVSALIEQADSAFRRDLGQLIQEHLGRWVAYHGGRRIGVAATKAELYQQCLHGGFKRGEFLVRSIEPDPGEIVIGPGFAECSSTDRGD
jgi:hypothetical protein